MMDRALATLLSALQGSSTHEDATRLLPTALTLLIRLSNPLNVSLLTSQLLQNPVLYPQPTELAPCRRIFTLFYTAAVRFAEAEHEDKEPAEKSDLTKTAWVKAVIQGADGSSPRWRHTLVLAGLLVGFSTTKSEHNLTAELRNKIENALVMVSNLSLSQPDTFDVNTQLCIVWVLNVAFPQISDYHRSLLDYDLLLPPLIDATFFSREGLEHGYWLGVIDADIKKVRGTKTFSWSPKSPMGMRVQEIRSRNFTSSLGPTSRLIAHSIENVRNVRLIIAATEKIGEFARNLALSWRQNKLSEIHQSEERELLDEETINITFPILLSILRDTLFAIVICMRAAFARILLDSALASDQRAPTLASACLHILRDTYFISHRFGQTSSSQFMFVYLTAIDILNQYPDYAQAFLTNIRPADNSQIPQKPFERLCDLYFLNTAEQFTLSLEPQVAEDLLLSAAMQYITTDGDKQLAEIYEAAHSVLLAVFSAPQNTEISSRHIPFYVEALMRSFPSVLSSRQFRLAVKSVVQLAAPPSPLSASMPLMQVTVLELMLERGMKASEVLLSWSDHALSSSSPQVSEKTTILLSMAECLPYLSGMFLEDWLQIIAEFIHKVHDPAQKALCQDKFWEILSNGEMDVKRAGTCVAWWSTRGGKELVLYGERPEELFEMSGSVQEAKI